MQFTIIYAKCGIAFLFFSFSFLPFRLCRLYSYAEMQKIDIK